MGSEGQSGGLVTLAIATSHLRVNAETLGLVTVRECRLAVCWSRELMLSPCRRTRERWPGRNLRALFSAEFSVLYFRSPCCLVGKDDKLSESSQRPEPEISVHPLAYHLCSVLEDKK